MGSCQVEAIVRRGLGRGRWPAAMRGVVPSANGQLVYIVDQDEAVRDSLKALIESHGFAVRDFAGNGEFLQGSEPGTGNCVLLGFDRYSVEAVGCLRSVRKSRPDLPVICIVGQGGIFPSAAIAAGGAFTQLERPIREATLMRAITHAVTRPPQ